MTPRLRFAVDIAYRAGRSTLSKFNVGVEARLKADESPVTLADEECEAMIRQAIREQYPGETILGEEQGLTGTGDDRWVIDPIDGTRSFINGVPLYGTLVAYERDGLPILGVCYFPALDEMLYAEISSGTFWNGRPCSVRQDNRGRNTTVCFGGLTSMIKRNRVSGLEAIANRGWILRSWCDAYGHALVATGRAEAMVDPVVERYDISAMKIIVEEAGGTFTAFDGGDPFQNREAIASNGSVHDTILEAFKS